MINFTVGPVQAFDETLKIGSQQIPYFRTDEFSKIMLDNENYIKKLTNAKKDSRAIFLTGSGTAAMESSIINTLTTNDKALIVNGGSFGKRFVDICKIHNIPYDEIKLQYGKPLTKSILSNYANKIYTAFIVNVHETSTGVHYDMDIISEFCAQHNLILIVDAVSSFIADEIDITNSKIDVLITGSQKALACPPGISIIVLSKRAICKISENETVCLYLDLKSALNNGVRGQTPFTPAVGTLLQINQRLQSIIDNGGIKQERNKIITLANDFRKKIKNLPLIIFSESLSNAITPVHPTNVSAYSVYTTLKDNYNIWVCPNGGDLKDKIFRVGHIGNLTINDNNKLIEALNDMNKKGLL